jgi:hypothetical protein
MDILSYKKIVAAQAFVGLALENSITPKLHKKDGR